MSGPQRHVGWSLAYSKGPINALAGVVSPEATLEHLPIQCPLLQGNDVFTLQGGGRTPQ